MTKKRKKKHVSEESPPAEDGAQGSVEVEAPQDAGPVTEDAEVPTDTQDEASETVEDTEEAIPDPIALLETEIESLKDQVLRSRAEFDNYRKRVMRDNERLRKMAAEALIRDLLPVVDNLELALEHGGDTGGALSDGVELVARQLSDVLKNNGVKPIAALGERFDPQVHEAVQRAESEDVQEDHVAQEFQRGYMLGDLVLRPSKVVVSAGVPQDNEEPEEQESAATSSDR